MGHGAEPNALPDLRSALRFLLLPPTAYCMTPDMSKQHAAVTQVHNAPKTKSNQIARMW